MKAQAYRNGKIPGRCGYGIDDAELARLFEIGLEISKIAGIMKISRWTVLAHLKKLGLRRTRRHTIGKPDAFAILIGESCYWAGFLAADGFVLPGHNGVGVELSAVDANHLRLLCRAVGRDETLWHRTRHRNGEVYKYVSVDLLSTQILENLSRSFHIVSRKSLILEPPELPQPLRRHFIRGYFDGDGCVCRHKKTGMMRLNIVSGSKQFLEWIWDTMREELGDLGQRTIGGRKNSKVCTLELTGNAAIKVLEWMYSDGGDALCLVRKREKFLEYKARVETRRAARANKRQTTIDKMVSLYIQGLSYSEIAAKLGTTKKKVSYYLRQTDTPKRSRKTDSLAGQQLRGRDQKMLAAHLAGEKAADIAKRFGIAKSSVWIAIRRAKGINGPKGT